MMQPCNTAAKVDEFFELVQWDPFQVVQITENGEGILSIFFEFILPYVRFFFSFLANNSLAYLAHIWNSFGEIILDEHTEITSWGWSF